VIVAVKQNRIATPALMTLRSVQITAQSAGIAREMKLLFAWPSLRVAGSAEGSMWMRDTFFFLFGCAVGIVFTIQTYRALIWELIFGNYIHEYSAKRKSNKGE
jgi:hypothetical protein